jgi:hypothetical protein
MTGSAFYTYVLKKFKRTDKSTEAYQAMTDVIADMRLQFHSEDFKEEAYSTGISTVGEYKLGLPSDFGHIIGNISITDTGTDETYPELVKVSKQEYDEMYADRLLSSTTSMDLDTPAHFCIYANQVFLGPVPDKTTYQYQFNYTTDITAEVTSATDPVPFTGYKERNTTRSGVLAELYDGMENFEEANYWRQMYLQGLSKLIANDESNIADDDGVQYRGF